MDLKRRFKGFTQVIVSSIIAVFATVAVVSAATTIGTDIATGGNMYASSTIAGSGAIIGYSTLGISGLSTLSGGFVSQASSTVVGPFTVTGALTLGTPLAVTSGGTGITTSPVYGQILVGNSSGTYTLTATSSLGLAGGVSVTAANTWTALQQFQGQASSTLFSVYGGAFFGATATSSFNAAGALTLATPLAVASGGTGASSFTAGQPVFFNGSSLVSTSTLAVSVGGTGITTSPVYGQILVGNSSGTYTLTATSSLGLAGGVSVTAANTWTALQQFQGQASSTLFSVYGGAFFGATATSSFNAAGALTLATPLAVASGGTGVTSSTGTGNVVLSASPTFTGTLIAANATLSGLASTTQLKVGSDSVSTVSGMIFGTCTISAVTVTATSSAYTICTGASGVTGSYTVFTQPGAPLPVGLILDAASSTATLGTLSVHITNATAGANLSTGAAVINFWAVR